MANRIKGIVVEIGGDTSGLQKALSAVTKEINATEKEIKDINKALKFDPKNTELLAQKEKALANEIFNVSYELSKLQQHYNEVNEYIKQGNKLTEEEQKKYEALQREIVLTKEKLQKLQTQSSDWTKVSKKIEEFSASVGKIGDAFTSLGKKMLPITGAITGFATYGVTYNAQLEKYSTALKTITGSAQEADRVMQQIKEDAKTTPFDVQGLVEANQLLLSADLSAESSRDTILALGDAIAATGGGNDELSRMAINLQQIKNVGEASALDIKQFAYAGIDIYGLLADYLGITKEEASDMKVTWEDLNGALINASKEGGKYFGAMADQSTTLNGQVSNLQDGFGQLAGSLTENLVPIVKDILDYMNRLMDKFNSMDENTKKRITTIGVIVATVGPLLIVLGSIFNAISKISHGISDFVKTIPKISTAFKGIGTVLGGLNWPLILIVTGIAAIIAIIVTLYKKCEWFRNGVNAIISGIMNFVTSAVENIKIFFTETIPELIDKIVTEILPNFVAFIGTIIETIKTKIIEFITKVWELITVKIPEIISKIVQFVAELPEKLWKWFLETIAKVIEFLANWLSTVNEKIPEIISAIVDKFLELPGKMLEIGKNIVEGLWNGISNAKDWLLAKVNEWCGSVLGGIKAFFGIHSPSTVFRDEVGRYLAEGVGVGFDKNIGSIISDMTKTLTKVTGKMSANLNLSSDLQNVDRKLNSKATPQIYNITMPIYSTQKITEAEMNLIFNTMNHRFGMSL